MFRLIRRAPWIALGAAGAYYMDGRCGPERRAHLKRRVTEMKDQWLTGGGSSGSGEGSWSSGAAGYRGTTGASPVTPSLSRDVVAARSQHLQAEEMSAGVTPPAPSGMAQQIMAESERRTSDRAAVTAETRTSEDTVEPPEPGGDGHSTLPGQLGGVGDA